ncbi:MAG TPA: NAD(P)-binding oxidoreductase [Roseiflexaceae bacterium]|nr:NAD(P)-binding oxidoreductase [Roseiflexaceae bacterium]
MQLLVIGATGRTGRLVVEQGLRRGHAITAFTRRPHELAGVQGLAQVILGDALNLQDVRKALHGQDAVISAVGTSGIARTLITAMRETTVRRLVMTSSRSIVATRPRLPVLLAWMIFRASYADLARAEGMLEVSGLDWSIVRATMLTDKPFTGHVHMDCEPNATGGDWTLTRTDYAMTLLDVAENPQMIAKALGVGGAKPVPGKARKAQII